jgi:methylated-DNA-protein-cysteine methyltransferase related protein
MPHEQAPHPTPREAVYAVVRCIPRGRVATYGQIAALAGIPRGARQVGYALAALDGQVNPPDGTPWHRVVNRHGQISYSLSRGGGDLIQKSLLQAEGVVFDDADTIDLTRYLWADAAHAHF